MASLPRLSSTSQIQPVICLDSSTPKPRVVIAGVPILNPLVTKGDLGSLGTAFLLTVILALPSAASASFPGNTLVNQVEQEQVIVCPPGNDIVSALLEHLYHGTGVIQDLLLVCP